MTDDVLAAKRPSRARTARIGRAAAVGATTLLFGARLVGSALAQDDQIPAIAADDVAPCLEPRHYRSRNFFLHTDLDRADAMAQLERLESVLEFATRYWGRRTSRIIECYVASDVTQWRDDALPHRLARIAIARIGGATVGFPGALPGEGRQRAVFYADAERGVAEHESIHAFCLEAFGATGPTWYKEGMAEVGRHGVSRRHGVCCPEDYVDFFQRSVPRSISDIVNQGESTAPISTTLAAISAEQRLQGSNAQAPLSSWTEADSHFVQQVQESYRWNWALCYFLCENPNYARRFHALGQGYLSEQDAPFDAVFADVRNQLEFEYTLFMRNFGVGYRVDLCRWDWSTRTHDLPEDRRVTVHVHAVQGYQATGISVSANQRYDYRCQGRWSLGNGIRPTDAAGNGDGQGRLVGAVLTGYTLSDPMDLGASGTFAAQSDGELFLRCSDRWTELSDNRGHVSATFRLSPYVPHATE